MKIAISALGLSLVFHAAPGFGADPAKPQSSPAPLAVAGSPSPESTRAARVVPTPRPTDCPAGMVRVGPEDRDCGAFGDCCRPAGTK